MVDGGNVAGRENESIDWTWPNAEDALPVKKATYEDVLNAPENKVAEILDGELVLSPRPALPHAAAQAAIHGKLWSHFDDGMRGPEGWVFLTEPELHFGAAIVVPDVASWRRERLPGIPDRPWLDLAPDWVCEVLSPSAERFDRGRKLRIYADAGVGHAWLVNPVQRTLEVLRLKDGSWTIVGVCSGSDVVRIKPFEAIELELRRLWPDEAPPSTDAG
jgi:Uma2 family endonuclease